jgi:hypothetical protein
MAGKKFERGKRRRTPVERGQGVLYLSDGLRRVGRDKIRRRGGRTLRCMLRPPHRGKEKVARGAVSSRRGVTPIRGSGGAVGAWRRISKYGTERGTWACLGVSTLLHAHVHVRMT